MGRIEEGAEKSATLLPSTSLQPHQRDVAATGLEPESKVLLYHSLGSGKSLSAIAASEAAADPYTAVVPASLRDNFRKEQAKFTDQATPANVVSYNAVAKGGVPPTDTVVFDEAHRLRNPDALQTRQAVELADRAKHLYLLSGSPVVNHPHDLVPMIRMLTGKSYSPEEFDRHFVDERKVSPGFFGWLKGVKPVKVPAPAHEDELKELLAGHVHYHAPERPDVETREERYEVPMGPEQESLYKGFWGDLPWMFRWKLQNEFPLSGEEMTRLSSFLSGPRQVGLSTYPFMKGKADAHLAYQQSPKLQKAVSLVQAALQKDPNAKAVAFSNFIDAGLTPYAAALERAKIPYGLFHGGLNDAARKKVVEDYNTGKTRVMLLGPSGSEGLSLKGTRVLQLLDPHWNSARSDQAKGRGIRFDSHTDLPLEDRNVTVQRFASRMPPGMMHRLWRAVVGGVDDPKRFAPGVDTYLEQMNSRKDQLNNQFLDLLKEVGQEKAGDDSLFPETRDYEPILVLAADLGDEPEPGDKEEAPFTIAVDLDGTLAEQEEPFNPDSIGDPRRGARKWLRRFHAAGARLVIFTVRGDTKMVADWLDEHDMPYDFINENPDQPEDGSGKVIAQVYWDDRAVNAQDLESSGAEVLERIKAGEESVSFVRGSDVLGQLVHSIVAQLEELNSG